MRAISMDGPAAAASRRLLRLALSFALVAAGGLGSSACDVWLEGEAPGGDGDATGDAEPVVDPVTVHEIIRMRVAGVADDAEEDPAGVVSLNSSDLELTRDADLQVIGVRWLARLPPGVTITAATVQLTVDETSDEATDLEIRGQAADDAPSFTTAAWDLSSRATTEASVLWSPTPWATLDEAGEAQRSPDLSPIIQEIIDRPGWASRQGLVLLITGSGHRVAKSRDGADGGRSSPLLEVEYDVEVTPPCASCPIDRAAYACPYLAEHGYVHASEPFFEPSQVIRIDIEMSEADWRYQLDNPNLEEYRPADVEFCGVRAENAGMRFKHSVLSSGNLAVDYPKNPMVIDLNEFVPGQRLAGLRKINLEYDDDPMLVAERLNWEMLATSGVDVSRVNYADLFVNHEYVGVFLNVERVDRTFANYHWGENDGHLYKHAYCGTFAYAGMDVSAYTADPRCYQPKPSDTVTDYQDLIHVIDVLNNTPDDTFAAAFTAVWEVDRWLPMMAGLQVLGYGDTPNANANNFYTYYPPAGAPARVALWDLDGGYFADGAPCEHPADVVNWDLFRLSSCYGSLPLFDRVIAVPEWRTTYLEAARDFLVGPFDSAAFEARVLELRAQLRPSLAADPLRRGDDAELAAGVDTLLDVQRQRVASVRGQLLDNGLDLP